MAWPSYASWGWDGWEAKGSWALKGAVAAGKGAKDWSTWASNDDWGQASWRGDGEWEEEDNSAAWGASSLGVTSNGGGVRITLAPSSDRSTQPPSAQYEDEIGAFPARRGSFLDFDAKGSNLTDSRDLMKQARRDGGGEPSAGEKKQRSRSRKKKKDSSHSRSRRRSRSRKRRRKKSTSSSSSSESKKEVKPPASIEQAPQAEEDGDEERIDRIKNAARVNRIKKRRQAARELLMVEPKAGTIAQSPVPAVGSEPTVGAVTAPTDAAPESILCIDDD